MTTVHITPRQLREFQDLDGKLYEVFLWLAEGVWPSAHPLRVTSIWRTADENRAAGARTQIHCTRPCRALDIGGRGIDPAELERIALECNKHWEYDPDRENLGVAYAKPHGTGPHIHLQVHPKTRRR